MEVSETYDPRTMERILTFRIPDRDFARIRFDKFDRTVLGTPKKGMSDVAQDLEIILRRYEQQFA